MASGFIVRRGGGGEGGSGGAAQIFIQTSQPSYSNGGLWIKSSLSKYTINQDFTPGGSVTTLSFPKPSTSLSYYNHYIISYYIYSPTNAMFLEYWATKAPSTSQALSYPRCYIGTYNMTTQTATLWTHRYQDSDDDWVTGPYELQSNPTNPWYAKISNEVVRFPNSYTVTSGTTTYGLQEANINTKTVSASSAKATQYVYGNSYYTEGNNIWFVQGSRLWVFNISTSTYIIMGQNSSILENNCEPTLNSIYKTGNNVYMIGARMVGNFASCVYNDLTKTITAVAQLPELDASPNKATGNGYVVSGNIIYFRYFNYVYGYSIVSNTYTLTATLYNYNVNFSYNPGYGNYNNEFMLLTQSSQSPPIPVYKFNAIGSAGSSGGSLSTDTLYIKTGGSKNYARIIKGQQGYTDVPIQGVYSVQNGVLTVFPEAYVSTGGAWQKVTY